VLDTLPRLTCVGGVIACAAVLAVPAVADDVENSSELVVQFHEVPGAADVEVVTASIGAALGGGAAGAGGEVAVIELRHAPHALGEPGEAHPLASWRVVRVPEGTDLEALAGVVASLGVVQQASANNVPEPAFIPNDPLFNGQWGPMKIDAPGAWDITTGDADILVGSIDTGTRVTHEDLEARIWQNDDPVNGIDDDGNGFVDDVNGWDFVQNNAGIEDVFGHGTQVAGIMSAGLNNGVGVAGLGNFTVLTGKWWHFAGTDADVAESVFYAVDNGADVLNLSLGCQCLMPMTEDALEYAHDNGVVSVAAAGNAGTSQPGYPASYPTAISVSAVTQFDQKAGFSNFGPTVDVAAPSPGISAPSPTGDSSYTSNFGGTSAASPHVAGVSALMLAANPELEPEEIRQILHETADDLGEPGFDNIFAWGRVNAGAAVAAAAAAACVADFDGDGELTITDFTAFQAAFVAGEEQADCNEDGVLNVVDFICFQGAFEQGC